MLTQEELDQLLEESSEQDSSSEEQKSSESAEDGAKAQAGSEADPLSQDELDSLLDRANDEEVHKEEAQSSEEGTSSEDDISWEDAFKEAAEGGDAAAAKAVNEGLSGEEGKGAPAAEFNELTKDGDTKQNKPELDFLLEIPLEVQVELGRSTMKIKDLLQLGQGSIVELNKMVGEPADIYVNRKLMAKGEVVVVNEKFGIKLTEIISPQERVKSLG